MQAGGLAHELPQVPLADALELLLLAERLEPARFDRGLVRWHARLCAENQLSSAESTLALAALTALKSPAAANAAEALAGLGERHALDREARVLAEWAAARRVTIRP